MAVLVTSEVSLDWAEVPRAPQFTSRESSSLESYASTSLSDSLAGSLSTSLADLSCAAPIANATTAINSGSSTASSSVGATPPPQLQRPRITVGSLDAAADLAAGRGLVAPVPSRASHGAARLLHTSSSSSLHVDVFEGSSLAGIAAAVAGRSAVGSAARSCLLPGSPAGSPDRRTPGGTAHGCVPAPELILAALSASLAAHQEEQQRKHHHHHLHHHHHHQLQQQQQQQQQLVGAQHGGASRAAAAAAVFAAQPRSAAPAGIACTTCSSVFADPASFRAHCASLEHAKAVLQQSLVMGVPGVAAQAAGLASSGLVDAGVTTSSGFWAPTSSAAATHCPTSILPMAGHTAAPLTTNTAALLASLGAPALPVAQAAARPSLPAMLRSTGTGGSSGTGAYMAAPQAPLVGNVCAPFCLTTCCNQVIDPQLDLVTHSLLKQLRQLDGVERAVGAHAPRGSPRPLRRLVGGLREVRKAVHSGTAAAVVAAVDIQETNPCAAARRCCSVQPGAEIAEICQLAALCGMPVVFALTRLGLGSIFGTNKRMSAVALTNVAGLESQMQQVMHMAAVGRARFDALVTQSAAGLNCPLPAPLLG